MKLVFIADGHLKGLDDPNQRGLVRFLDALKDVDTLVVLGDLFDFWTGFNDVVYYRYLPVLNSLLKLKERGISIVYLEGNHDFSMGDFFKGVLGASVYPDHCEMAVDGKKVFLSHGDTVYMSKGYSLWRGFLRSSVFSAISKIVTPGFVAGVAEGLSKKSREYGKGAVIEDKLREFARKRIEGGVDVVVLGHSHVPGVARIGKGVYANPGSWADKSYLVYTNGEFKAGRFEG